MARLNRDVVQVREKEAFEAFTTGSRVKDVNDALYAKYGSRMGLKRLYELKEQAERAKQDQAVEVVTAEVVTEAPQDQSSPEQVS